MRSAILPALLLCVFAACDRDPRGPHKLCSPEVTARLQQLIDGGRAVVVVPIAELCSQPGCPAALGDQVLLGDVLKILPGQLASCLRPGSAVLQVETEAGYRGFVNTDALDLLPPGKPGYRDGGPLVRVTSRLANLYTLTDVTKIRPLVTVPVDTRLRLLAPVDDRWLKVELPSGTPAYVQRGDVTELPQNPPPPSASCVIEHARQYAGTTYLWGGRSTLGIDCSGLVSNAFAACGVVPPRDARPQFGWPKFIEVPMAIDKLVPGDLVFFGEKPEGEPHKVTHVGIHVGGGRFIHATTHERPMVQESDLADPHWTAIWLGARRYPFP